MQNESNEPVQDEMPLLKRLRGSIFPIAPGDSASVKILKTSGFYLFTVMALVVTLLLGGAIMFVL